jgi:DNA-binding XRE family transcriptional regulator
MSCLTPATCRAGRALVDLTQEDLARTAGVCRSTIRAFEKGHHELQQGSKTAIIRALELRGVALLTPENGGEGVRLKHMFPSMNVENTTPTDQT